MEENGNCMEYYVNQVNGIDLKLHELTIIFLSREIQQIKKQPEERKQEKKVTLHPASFLGKKNIFKYNIYFLPIQIDNLGVTDLIRIYTCYKQVGTFLHLK